MGRGFAGPSCRSVDLGETMSEIDRRRFLQQLGIVGSVSALLPGDGDAQTAPGAGEAAAEQGAPLPAYLFFTPPEAAFVEAAVDRLIPADELTPSGTQCGVALFIDRQLAGAWGAGERLYRQGPWQTGKPEQGYQLPLTPAELYRNGIAATHRHCQAAHEREFDRLDEATQVAVLQGLERGEIELEGLPSRVFFNALLQNTMEGFFADPIYGGNRGKVAWKMIGYPGVIAVYAEDIKNYRNRPYDAEPTSILDLI
jgi:gluconate 2-dehydrogenase gamma chain